MLNSEEMLESIQEEMNKYNQQFKDINTEIEKVSKEYEQRIQSLMNKREQTRGAYTSLYNQLIKFKSSNDTSNDVVTEDKTNIQTQTVTTDKEIENKEVVNKSKKTTKKKTTENNSLTPEEIQKITQLTTNKSNKDDIPDYLKDEYKKLK